MWLKGRQALAGRGVLMKDWMVVLRERDVAMPRTVIILVVGVLVLVGVQLRLSQDSVTFEDPGFQSPTTPSAHSRLQQLYDYTSIY